jgi:hypothetical protein
MEKSPQSVRFVYRLHLHEAVGLMPRISAERARRRPRVLLVLMENCTAPSTWSACHEIVLEARQRQLHRRLMKKLLQIVKPLEANGKKTTQIYRTNSWELRSKAIFFYMRSSLGNMDMEVTCTVFSLNVNTFSNWIRQKQYYGKWLQYVESFSVGDILPSVPSVYRDSYANVDGDSKVVVDTKFKNNCSGKVYVSAASEGNRQKTQKLAAMSNEVFYIRKTTKTAGSGRQTKYKEQEEFIIKQIVQRWETGDPLSKASAYDLLIKKFGHQEESQRTEWELKMSIHSGNISPALSQWLSRVLERHRFSVRKESISQTVPTNWLQVNSLLITTFDVN